MYIVQTDPNERQKSALHNICPVMNYKKFTNPKLEALFRETMDFFRDEENCPYWYGKTIEGQSPQYWIVRYGYRNFSQRWRNAIEDGVYRIGWEEIGDLCEYENHNEIRDALELTKLANECRWNPKYFARGCWNFYNNMKIGDVIIAKGGLQTLYGWGVVTGDYEYRDSYNTFRHTREVHWKKTGKWEIENLPTTILPLVNWTAFPELIEEIRKIIWED